MAELKLPRLLAAAKEFNIGQDTLIEFLVKKGYNRDDLKPTAKLLEEQYYAKSPRTRPIRLRYLR
jgi:translation initiation factor IF-2